jgi:hypothetical protein
MSSTLKHTSHPTAQLCLGGEGPNALQFKGVLREIDPSVWLMPLVREVHRLAVERQLDEVVVDLRELEYANAALFKCLVEWIRMMREEQAVHYRLRVRSAPKHRWQQVGVAGLRAVGAELVEIE